MFYDCKVKMILSHLQMSYWVWRKLMYPFWITVIAYSVIMLILVYTYQFKQFPTYWEYLYIDKDL